MQVANLSPRRARVSLQYPRPAVCGQNTQYKLLEVHICAMRYLKLQAKRARGSR